MAARTRQRKRVSHGRGARRAAAPKKRAEPAKPEREAPERQGPRPFWSGTISFGLVSVPVDLFSAVRSTRLRTRMLTRDGTPLQRRYFCPEDERDIPGEELARGYELAPEQHVVITDDELEALAPRASRDIDLRRFVPVDEVDPFLFESSYVLAPSGDSSKAYRLLAQVMEKEGRAGIATFVMRGKERLIAILARDGILHAEVLRFADEVRSPEDADLPAPAKVPRELVDEFARAFARAAKPVDPATLVDEETVALHELVEEKRERGEDLIEAVEAVPEEEGEPAGEPTDILAALKRSLASGTGKGSGAERRPRSSAPAKRSRTRRSGRDTRQRA